MILKQLELENFGVTSNNQIIKFRKGINLITGNNGEGKSTALKALSLLLFNYSKGRHQDYINWKKDSFNTKLNLEHDNHKYEIKFSAGKKAEGKILTIDDNDYYERSEANDKLAEIFNPKLMLASMISFEGETDLITVKPAERREHLKKIYDLDFKTEVTRLKLLIDTLINEDIAKIEKEIFVLESIEYDINDLKDLPFDIETYKNYKNLSIANNDRIKKIIELNLVHEQLVKKLKDLNYNLDVSNLEIKNLKLSLEKLKNSKVEIDNTNLYSTLNKYENELENFNDDNIKLLENEISTFKKKRPISIDENKLSSLKSEVNVLELKRFNLNKKIKDLENGICPVCGGIIESSDISQWNNEYDNLNELISQKYIEIEEHNKKIKEKKEIDDFNLGIKESIEKIKNNISQLKIENNNRVKELKTLIEHEKLNIESTKKNQELQKEIEFNKIVEIENNIKNKELNIKSILDDIAEVKLSIKNSHIEDVSKIEEENKNIQELLSNYDKIDTERNLVIKKNDSEILRKEKNTEKIKSLKIERDTLASEVAEYKEQKEILNKRFPSFVIATLIKTIEHEMNDFIIKTYEGKYEIKILEKKDAIYVVYGNKQVDVSLASGYEKQVFSLAYKNALNKISGTGVLILDEVDSASSIENSLQLYKIVGSMTDLYQQIIIITHKPEVQELLINEHQALAYEVNNGEFRRIV